MKHPTTFTEANAWVHLAPESFTRHFPSIRSVWQTESERLWVEAEARRRWHSKGAKRATNRTCA